MQIPKNITIKNSVGKTTAYLSPSSDGLKDCYPDVRLNGESTLEFSLPSTSEKLGEITPECQIWAGGRVYGLLKDDAVDTVRDGNNKQWSKFMAVERWAELDTSYVEPSISNDPTARPPSDLSITIVGGGSNLSGELYATGTAGHALYAILQGSGWTLGTCDVTGIRDLEIEKTSRLGIIKQIQNIWGGYLVWDSVNRIVHLRSERLWQNYTGFQVRYRKNLKHITRTQSNKLVTKLYAFGHDDLDIANVNGGNKYVTNNSYTSREYVGIYKNQDIYDQAELKEKAIAELELICRPRYLYKVKLVDLRTLPEYSHEDFELGDMIDIVDPSVAPDSPRPRLIRHKYNLFNPWECELDIGDPEERLVEKLKASFGTTGFIDGKFNGNGDFSGNSLEDDTVTDKKIKNLTAEKITAGFISADRIQAGSISIGKVNSEFVPGLDLTKNLAFSSYATNVTKLYGDMYGDGGVVTVQGTAIEQNASQILLHAGRITTTEGGVTTNTAAISVNAEAISLQATEISTIDGKTSTNSSSITQLSDSISSIVSFTDVTGAQISSKINQTANDVSISASKIDLTGITSIYSPNKNSYARFGSSQFSAFELVYDSHSYFNIEYLLPGVSLRASGREFLSASHYGTTIYGDVSFGTIYDRGNVDFSNANVSGLPLMFA